MYGVSAGQVKIFKISPDGREQVLRIVEPGQCFVVADGSGFRGYFIRMRQKGGGS